MFELLIWLQEATLARWTQSSGPLCLWQCLKHDSLALGWTPHPLHCSNNLKIWFALNFWLGNLIDLRSAHLSYFAVFRDTPLHHIWRAQKRANTANVCSGGGSSAKARSQNAFSNISLYWSEEKKSTARNAVFCERVIDPNNAMFAMHVWLRSISNHSWGLSSVVC